MHVIDRFDVMALHLAGDPLPPLPAIPGRVHKAPPTTDDDPFADRWEKADHGRTGTTTDASEAKETT